ncbi:MAG: rhodanese-like domain-containing protein [Cetobacterium sp.]|uniref:rhodanese-like domain-containing protein n=1 Tax=unclassified Cetobacterium TaxID=2630983 RepID=UPI00163C7D5D|nr:rhodanese-like domain-containing protein [Cetobacterium sp. 2A]MBC2856359.1 rhodanese-like domain-containing protein [Cetobacterium sp. 2A]
MIIEIDNAKALELLENNSIMVIDARTPYEIDDSELLTEDAINLDISNKDHFEMMVEMLSKDLEYLIYSNNGIASIRLARILEEKGFETIYNLTEGLTGLDKDNSC